VGGGNEMEVEAINEAGAKVGDRIVLSFRTSSLLKATFLLYVFPILVLILGAVIGQLLGMLLGVNLSATSAIAGFLFFFASVWIVKSKANRMAKSSDYRPRIIKITKSVPPRF
jgi:sigma-E factor negative regulatory protein RseC